MTDVPVDPAWAWFGGSLVPFVEAHVPLEDRGLQFGESLYEVIAVARGEPFRLSDHVDRMRSGAGEIGLAEGVPSLSGWRSIVAELHRHEPHPSAILYAQVTGGTAPRSHVPKQPPPPFFFAYLRRFTFPSAEETARGIAAVTLADQRWQRSDLKTVMLLPAVLARKEALARGAEEVIFVGRDGLVNEGAVSNVFAVLGGAVTTPPASRRNLAGITGMVVEEICRDAGVPFSVGPLAVSELRKADELFVASTTALLMPVVRMDDVPVGVGSPGRVTLLLAQSFRDMLWGPAGPPS
jgi:D-alanine transaminase